MTGLSRLRALCVQDGPLRAARGAWRSPGRPVPAGHGSGLSPRVPALRADRSGASAAAIAGTSVGPTHPQRSLKLPLGTQLRFPRGCASRFQLKENCANKDRLTEIDK